MFFRITETGNIKSLHEVVMFKNSDKCLINLILHEVSY